MPLMRQQSVDYIRRRFDKLEGIRADAIKALETGNEQWLEYAMRDMAVVFYEITVEHAHATGREVTAIISQ